MMIVLAAILRSFLTLTDQIKLFNLMFSMFLKQFASNNVQTFRFTHTRAFFLESAKSDNQTPLPTAIVFTSVSPPTSSKSIVRMLLDTQDSRITVELTW